MAIETTYDGSLVINSVDLSDHLIKMTINDGQETRDVTAHGDTVKKFRPGLGTPSIDAEFWNDLATGSVEPTLRALIGFVASSSGFTTTARKWKNRNIGSTNGNPQYQMVGILDGDLRVIDGAVGEPDRITCRIIPYASFTVLTSSSS